MQNDVSGLQFMKWLREHQEFAYFMIDAGDRCKGEELLDILEELKKNDLYDMIIAAIIHTSGTAIVDKAVKQFYHATLIEAWEQKGSEVMYNRFYDILKKEIELQNSNMENKKAE